MEIILQENYPSLGYVGDLVEVKNGYARNFLIPQGIAVEASSRNAKLLKHRMRQIEAKKAKLKGEAEAYADSVKGVPLNFELKMASSGKSFGSITSRDIHKKFVDAGHELDRKQVRLSDPIRVPGNHTVTIQLHADVSVELPVYVEGLEIEKKELPPKKAKKEASEEAEEGEEQDLEAVLAAAEEDDFDLPEEGESASSEEETSEDEEKQE